MHAGEPFQGEYYSERLKDWLEAFAYPCDEGLAVYFHSISDRKKLATQVQQSEQKLKYVAKATLDVVWERDLADDSIHWDEGLRKLGYPANAEGGKSITSSSFWLQRIHPQERQNVLNSLDAVLKSTSDHWEATYRFLTADGDFIHVMDRGVVVRDSELRPCRMIGGIADISERIRFEEHLQQNQRIESIGKLTGGLAHDFNNLLTVILGNAELLSYEAAHDRRLLTFTDAIASSAMRGTDLTRRLLAFARRQSLEPSPVNLNRLLLSMEGLLNRSLGANIAIRIMPGSGLHTALVDNSQLEGAILNLCINSRDAMPGGGEILIETMNVTLTESCRKFLEDVVPGEYVAIRVSDTGCGIQQEMLGQVFEPFFTTKERGKGTGLGLSTVYGFIRQSNGYVDIASVVDAGTQVTLYLPITLQQELHAEKPVVNSAYARGEETILMVEDDTAVSSFAKQFLVSLGYNVLLADTGPAALAILATSPGINLLFTDIVMPGGMDGAELGRIALSRYPHLKVLYTSGYTDNALIQQGSLDPEGNFLSKPYTLTRMAGRIRRVLGEPVPQALNHH
jgi:signal transduction histidine kinase